MIEIRQTFAQLRSTDWLRGAPTAAGSRDALWLNRRGAEMTPQQWVEGDRYVLGLLLGARAAGESDLLLLFNAENADWAMTLPNGRWQAIVDTGQRDGRAPETAPVTTERLLKARSVTLLRRLMS